MTWQGTACAGPCFAVLGDRGAARVRCLAADLTDIRHGAAPRRLAVEPVESASRVSRPLGCRAGFAFTVYGLRIGVRANDPALLARVRDHLHFARRPACLGVVDRLYSLVIRHPRALGVLYSDAARLAWARDPARLLETFERNLDSYLAAHAPRVIFMHAGVVGWRGRAIVIPGRSLSGKTTLVTELVRAGATYYSDEFAVLDTRGQVHPYPRPLSIRDGTRRSPERWPVESLGGRVGTRPLPVGLVVATAYRPGARWRPRRLSPGPAALELLDNTVAAKLAPARALAAIGKVVLGADIFKGTRGEAADVARAILGVVRGAPPPPRGHGGRRCALHLG